MSEAETFVLDGTRVAVEERPDALTYTFSRVGPTARPILSPSFFFVLVVYPLGLLGLIAYAHSKVANRPEWEEILTATCAAQLLLWLVAGTAQFCRMLRWWRRSYGTALTFTRTHVRHGADRVCELEQIRGLRLFVYPPAPEKPNADATPPDRPAGATEAGLSLVIGDERHTHGLLDGFPEQPLRTLAEHIHRRLSAFCADQGMMATLGTISVVETTAADATRLMHTRPATRSRRYGPELILTNRFVGLVWCVLMLAGLFASGRMIIAAGFRAPFILPHCLLGLMHFYLLAYHLGTRIDPPKPSDAP